MMETWHKASEWQKLGILGGGLAIVMLLAYFLSIRETLELLQMKSGLEAQRTEIQAFFQQSAANASQRAQTIQAESSLSSAQSKLLVELEQSAQNAALHIEHIAEPELSTKNGKRIVSLSVTAQGGFHDQIRLVHQLEQNLPSLYLQSTSLRSQLDRRTKRTHLIQELHFKALIL